MESGRWVCRPRPGKLLFGARHRDISGMRNSRETVGYNKEKRRLHDARRSSVYFTLTDFASK